jgi:hypothetical protein
MGQLDRSRSSCGAYAVVIGNASRPRRMEERMAKGQVSKNANNKPKLTQKEKAEKKAEKKQKKANG